MVDYPSFSTRAAPTIHTVLLWESPFGRSRETVTIAGGDGAARSLPLGTVIGKRLYGAPVVTAGGANTGDGTLTSVAAGTAAKVGDYVLTAEGANVFSVVDPDGIRLSDVTVGGTLIAAALTLTVNAGSTAFAAGDSFTVTVPEGDGKVTAIDWSATDGTQLAHGVMVEPKTAPDGVDATGVALVRDLEIMSAGLVWPEGSAEVDTDAQLARLKHLRGVNLRVTA